MDGSGYQSRRSRRSGLSKDPKVPCSGKWRATKKGQDFLEGRIAVPRFVYIYNQATLRFDGQPVTFRECLGKRFDFGELMSGKYDEMEAVLP